MALSQPPREAQDDSSSRRRGTIVRSWCVPTGGVTRSSHGTPALLLSLVLSPLNDGIISKMEPRMDAGSPWGYIIYVDGGTNHHPRTAPAGPAR